MLEAIASQVEGYPGLLLFCSASGLVVPVPEDVSLLWAGMRVASGEWTWTPTVSAAVVGVQLRDLLAWGIGRLAGDTLLDSRLARRMIGAKKLARAQRLVGEHGALAVLFGRFFIGFRAPVFMVAGAMRLPLRQFLRWDAVGLVITVPGMIALGYEFGAPLLEATRWALARSRLVIAAFVLVALVTWLRRRLARASDDETETPDDEPALSEPPA